MDRYIDQLIEDFNLSESQAKPEPEIDDSYEAFEEHMLKIEEGECVSSKEKVGVSYDELPPADKMTDKQVERLLEAMLNSLSANGTGVSFP